MKEASRSGFMFGDRRSAAAFWLGSLVVAIGVGLHLPMFLMARDMGYMLAGMPMDNGMLAGMALIVLGTAVAGYGLLPKGPASFHHDGPLATIAPPEDAPLTRAHWRLMLVLSAALIIDIMKPASLGFVTPGMRAEYAPPEQTHDPIAQDVHCLVQCRAAPERMWVQHHNGIFASSDESQTFTEITGVEPSTFGFAVAVHPRDPVAGAGAMPPIPANTRRSWSRSRPTSFCPMPPRPWGRCCR